MRTREKLSLTDSAEDCAFTIHLNENKGGAESDSVTENHDSPLPEMRRKEGRKEETKERTKEQTKEGKNKRRKEVRNERTNEQMNERTTLLQTDRRKVIHSNKS